jgi:hypothetical protein
MTSVVLDRAVCRHRVPNPTQDANKRGDPRRLLSVLFPPLALKPKTLFLSSISLSTSATGDDACIRLGVHAERIHIEMRDLEVEKEYTMSSLTVVPSSF